MSRSLFYAAAVACVAGASVSWADVTSRAPDHHALTPEIIEALEPRIVMPDPRRPLTHYVRYYTLVKLEDGTPYISGELFATKPGEGYWKVVAPHDVPWGWSDGGCARLSFGARFRTMEIDQPLCNFG